MPAGAVAADGAGVGSADAVAVAVGVAAVSGGKCVLVSLPEEEEVMPCLRAKVTTWAAMKA